MRISKFFEDLEMDERYSSEENRHKHYEKHIVRGKEYDVTEEQYEQDAEDLAKTPVDYKNIFGYMSKNEDTGKISYCKWNKNTELFTAYFYKDGEPLTITSFRRDKRGYESEKWSDKFPYVDEIPSGK